MDTREKAMGKAFSFAGKNINKHRDIVIMECTERFIVKYIKTDRMYENVIADFPFSIMESGDVYEVKDRFDKKWIIKRFSRMSEEGCPVFVNDERDINSERYGLKYEYYRLLCKKKNFEGNPFK